MDFSFMAIFILMLKVIVAAFCIVVAIVLPIGIALAIKYRKTGFKKRF